MDEWDYECGASGVTFYNRGLPNPCASFDISDHWDSW